MAHEILSVKMYELDKKLEQTHSRIQLAESMDTERLHQQIQNLRQECQESRFCHKRSKNLPKYQKQCEISVFFSIHSPIHTIRSVLSVIYPLYQPFIALLLQRICLELQ